MGPDKCGDFEKGIFLLVFLLKRDILKMPAGKY